MPPPPGPLPLACQYRHIAGAVSVEQVSPTPVVLHAVTVNTAGTSVTVFDTDDPSVTSGRTVAVVGAVTGSFVYDARLVRGLVVTTSGAGTDVTLTYGAVPS